jgi:short-subunit dehydrogenase
MATQASRLVFITGASSGLGQALASRYHQAGYRLALAARRTDEVKTWIGPRGISVDSYQIYSVDVTNPDSLVAAARACLASQGVPDVVIACAGISVGVDTADRADIDVMAQTYLTNNIGTAATFHAFLGAMQQRQSGTLVGIGSVNGIRGFAGHGANCPSKAALISYCECLRLELKKSGVRVVTLCPGYVATPLTRNNTASMPFLLQPEEFADRAFKAIQAGVSYRVIPWQMGLVAKLLRLMPNWLFDRAFAGRARKPRRKQA